jgi:hypothetical protein
MESPAARVKPFVRLAVTLDGALSCPESQLTPITPNVWERNVLRARVRAGGGSDPV